MPPSIDSRPVSKVASALGSLGQSTGVQPSSGESEALREKNANIEQYTNSLQTPASQPKPKPGGPAPAVDRTGAKPFGSRKGEKRIDTAPMMKPLGVPSYEDGIDSVPNDGLAMLHAGEKVTPASENKDSKSKSEKRVKGALGGDTKKLSAKKGSKKSVHKITVHRSANGGVVLEHHLGDGKSEMHHHPNFKSASDHMAEHFQDEESGSEAGSSEGNEGPGMATPPSAPQSTPNPEENIPNPKMATPSSFAEGGVVQESGLAMVHKGEKVTPAPDKEYGKSYTQEITGTGPAKLTVKSKPFVPFGGDPKSQRPTKKESRDEINNIRKNVPDSEHENWMNNPKVAARTSGSS